MVAHETHSLAYPPYHLLSILLSATLRSLFPALPQPAFTQGVCVSRSGLTPSPAQKTVEVSLDLSALISPQGRQLLCPVYVPTPITALLSWVILTDCLFAPGGSLSDLMPYPKCLAQCTYLSGGVRVGMVFILSCGLSNLYLPSDT